MPKNSDAGDNPFLGLHGGTPPLGMAAQARAALQQKDSGSSPSTSSLTRLVMASSRLCEGSHASGTRLQQRRHRDFTEHRTCKTRPEDKPLSSHRVSDSFCPTLRIWQGVPPPRA